MPLLSWDREVERWQVAHRAGFLDPIFEGLTRAGTYGAIWLAIAAVAALVLRRPQIFVWTLVADAVGELASDALKGAIPRARPHVHALVARPHTHSFPSGHATTSFACATVLALLLPRLRIPFFLLAAAVAWSRVYVGVHYPLDVLAGAALGVGIGLGVARALPRLAEARRRSRRTTRSG
ncbi:MAG TPA: phosphatase PAP2 family protein [Gaiellaceae bacterium]